MVWDGKCQICGYNKCPKALELHHINPLEKEHTISSILASCRNWQLLFDEIKKCIMLCANCHREVHENLTQLPLNFHIFDEKLIKEKFFKRDTSISFVKTKPSKVKISIIKPAKPKQRRVSKSALLRIELIQNSTIDFSKYGWVQKVSILTGLLHQHINRWMKLHMPETYETAFKRKI